MTRELDQFTQLSIVQGPVCVYSDETGTSYWFWQVKVISSGEIGWVAEATYHITSLDRRLLLQKLQQLSAQMQLHVSRSGKKSQL